MNKKIVILQGHPDPGGNRYGHALAAAYTEGARAAGHKLRSIEVAKLDFPILRTQEDWQTGLLPDSLREAQQDLFWADHVVIFFPLWLGTLPALFKAFLEQVLRVGVSGPPGTPERSATRPLAGKSVRIVVTMGMPALVFRWYFLAHGLKSLERSILGFCGAGPIRRSLIGSVEGSAAARGGWLDKMQVMGRAAR